MERRKKWLYLQIETKNRELHSRVLLALEAMRRNHAVIIGSKGRIINLLQKVPPGLVLFKDHASSATFSNMKIASSFGHRIAVLDEEMIVTHPDEIFRKVRINEDCFSLIDTTFLLGNEHKELYSRLNVLEKFKSWAITGNPRFDLLRPEIRNYDYRKVLKLKKEFGAFILVNTNFAQGNHADGSKGFLFRLARNGFLDDVQLKEYYQSIVNERGILFDEYCNNVFPTISEKFPDKSIIIRTHPEENDKTYH